MSDLFKLGDFELHSGDKSDWIIDCDALSDGDLKALVMIGVGLVQPFGTVFGIKDGGIRFADAIRKHRSGSINNILIVDDVMTTGNSIKKVWDKDWNRGTLQALVIFSRTSDPALDWVHRIFDYRGPQ